MTDPKDCKQVLSVTTATIIDAFKNKMHQATDKILACFYCCYKELFVKWAVITYSHYPEDQVLFIANNAFNDSVVLFTEKAAIGGLYDGNATVKTVLNSFYRNKLREGILKEKRLAEKIQKHEAAVQVSHEMVADTYPENREILYTIVEQALGKMEPADRQIIIWRHLEEKSCDEIARLLAINVNSATNRIYRCMQRLRQLTENTGSHI